MKKVIYLDNAATTKVRPEVVEAMLPFYTEYYGNPSAVYEFSTPCKEALAKARETVANSLGAKDNEIYFTNGGSESDNWALIATAEAYASKGKHIRFHRRVEESDPPGYDPDLCDVRQQRDRNDPADQGDR